MKLRRHHMAHHFKTHNMRFGVSTWICMIFFGRTGKIRSELPWIFICRPHCYSILALFTPENSVQVEIKKISAAFWLNPSQDQ
jgi:hypothetical protein